MKTDSSEALDLTAEDIAELKELASRASLSQILKAVKLFGQLELGLDNYSTLPLELALVDCTLPSLKDSQEQVKESEPIKPASTVNQEATPPPKKPQPEMKPSPEPEPVLKTPEPAPQTEPPAKTAGATPDTSLSSSSELENLRLNWKQLIISAPDGTGRTPAAALLRSARPTSIEQNIVVLSFKFPLHKENMEKLENQKTAERILSHCLGRPCRVRCVYEPEDNHLVQTALKMGARIVDAEEK
jgi:hypothetical protein